MKFKRGFLIICLIVCLISIAGVSAVDVNDTNNMTSTAGTFSDLANEIADADGELNLTRNYTYNMGSDYAEYKEGITIYKSITINGNGYTIDGKNSARAFKIWTSDAVVLKNITFFKNYASSGGAVYSFSDNGIIINCSFLDCHAKKNGGAIYWDAENATLRDCRFKHCWVYNDEYGYYFGGAVHWCCYNSVIANCSFERCNVNSYYSSSYRHGGAVYCMVDYDNNILANCSFVQCSAQKGGAVVWGSYYSVIANSTFKDCSAEYGGALCWESFYSVLDNCEFRNCSASRRGGAIYYTGSGCNVSNSIFSKNKGYGSDWYCEGVFNVSNISPTSKRSTVLKASDVNITYGSSEYMLITLIDGKNKSVPNQPITVYLNGTYYDLETDGNGRVQFAVPSGLDSGTYIANISYGGSIGHILPVSSAGNIAYYPSSTTANVVVSKLKMNISCDDVSVDYYDGSELVAGITSEATGKAIKNARIVVSINGRNYTVKSDSKGQVKVSTNGLAPGTYTATISYLGNAKYDPTSTTAEVVVNRAGINISCDDVSVLYNDGSEFAAAFIHAVTGKSVNNAKAWLEVNGKKYSVMTNSTGMAVFSTNGINPGNYTAIVYYAGGAKYNPANASFNLVVNKAPTIVSAAFNGTDLIASITNGITGKAIANAKITVTINGTTYSMKSGSDGLAVFSLEGIDLKDFSAAVSYAGNAKYFSSKIVIKKSETRDTSAVTTAYDRQNREITATVFRTASGNPIKAATVVIKVGSDKYSLTTDSNGQVRISTEGWASGLYTVKTSYAGTTKITSTNNEINILVDD